MTNFDINLDSIVSSSLYVKASGSIDNEIINDLKLPDGESIDKLLANEEEHKKSK